jgi:hypothetical protein
MKTRLLSHPEFKATFATPMRDVLATATNVTNIWPYVAAIPKVDLGGHFVTDGCVEHVYRNGIGTFDHVLVATRTKNVFVAVIVDLVQDAIMGHYLLDLNREYGLDSTG